MPTWPPTLCMANSVFSKIDGLLCMSEINRVNAARTARDRNEAIFDKSLHDERD